MHLHEDRDALRDRLGLIPGQRERETGALPHRYAEPTARSFPAVVTFRVSAALAARAGNATRPAGWCSRVCCGLDRCQTPLPDFTVMAELDGHPATPEALRALALTNFGHFTSMRVDDGRVRGLPLHVARLVRDCRTVFAANLDPQHVLGLVRQAVGGRTGTFIVRVTVFDPALELGHPGGVATPHVLVTTRPAAPAVLPPLRVKSCAYVRELPAVKHIGLFGALHHRRAAQLDGFDDALFTDPAGVISEGPTWNVGFFDGASVRWPRADVLAGVTMTLLQRVHEHITAPVTVDILRSMQAAFATNASIGIRPIGTIDGVDLPAGHPILDELRAEYTAIPGEPLD